VEGNFSRDISVLNKTRRYEQVWGSADIPPRIFNAGTRRMQVVSLSFQLLFPPFYISMMDGTKVVLQEAVVNAVPLN
jgi:hypothetical protein